MKNRTRFLSESAVIAAIYAALTILLSPLSYGPVQLRIAEALTVLPVFTPAAIPGLFMGCLLSNVMSPSGLPDLIFGSLATLIGAVGCYALRKKPALALLPAVLSNAVIVGSVLYYTAVSAFGLVPCMLWVGLGELISCYALGYPLYLALRKRTKLFLRER